MLQKYNMLVMSLTEEIDFCKSWANPSKFICFNPSLE